jgi:hypothetical protein
MTNATPSATSTSPYSAEPAKSPSDETPSWFAWGVAAGASLLVVLILVGAFFVNPIASLLSGLLLAAGIGATYLGVWLDDQDGPVTITSPLVLFVAVVALVLSVMTITGVFDFSLLGSPDFEQDGPVLESSEAGPGSSSTAAPASAPAK